MEKYWVFDLKFVKAKGKYVRMEHMFEGYFKRHFTYEKYDEYELSNYIKSEVVNEVTEWTFLSESGEPYEYLEITKRFIIPSEVIISRKFYEYKVTHRNEILKKSKIESSIKYTVDENKMKLKPSEIIYYHEETKEPYVYFFGDVLRKVNDKKLIIYDKKSELYKYYNKFTDEEGGHRTNLSGTKAIPEIKADYMYDTYPVTPVENVEQVMI